MTVNKQVLPPAPTPTPPAADVVLRDGDINSDGKWNYVDISAFFLQFNKTNVVTEADLNGDKVVNSIDYSKFITVLIDKGVIGGSGGNNGGTGGGSSGSDSSQPDPLIPEGRTKYFINPRVIGLKTGEFVTVEIKLVTPVTLESSSDTSKYLGFDVGFDRRFLNATSCEPNSNLSITCSIGSNSVRIGSSDTQSQIPVGKTTLGKVTFKAIGSNGTGTQINVTAESSYTGPRLGSSLFGGDNNSMVFINSNISEGVSIVAFTPESGPIGTDVDVYVKKGGQVSADSNAMDLKKVMIGDKAVIANDNSYVVGGTYSSTSAVNNRPFGMVNGDAFLGFSIPDGTKNGKVKLMLPDGTIVSSEKDFTVTPGYATPIITDVNYSVVNNNPGSLRGRIGSGVLIQGKNLGPARTLISGKPEYGIYFNGTKGQLPGNGWPYWPPMYPQGITGRVWTSRSIDTIILDGSTTGKITVVNAWGNSAQFEHNFTITP